MNNSQAKEDVDGRATLVALSDLGQCLSGRINSPLQTFPTTAEINLLRACCLDDKESLESLKLWLAEGLDQSNLPLHLHRLIPTLYSKVPSSKEFLNVRNRYMAVYRHTWAANTIRLNYLKQVLDLLAENHITAALHRGILLSIVAYPDIGCRFNQDADLLISPDDKFRALKLLNQAGWRNLFPDQSELLTREHSVDLVRDKGEILKLHWHAVKENRSSRAQANLMNSLETISLSGSLYKAIPINTLFYQSLAAANTSEERNLSCLVDAFFLLRSCAEKIDLIKIGKLALDCHRHKLITVCEIFESVFETDELRLLKLNLRQSSTSKLVRQILISPAVQTMKRLNLYPDFYKPLP